MYYKHFSRPLILSDEKLRALEYKSSSSEVAIDERSIDSEEDSDEDLITSKVKISMEQKLEKMDKGEILDRN